MLKCPILTRHKAVLYTCFDSEAEIGQTRFHICGRVHTNTHTHTHMYTHTHTHKHKFTQTHANKVYSSSIKCILLSQTATLDVKA